MVECQLPKLDVAGSIPVARSRFQLANLSIPTFARWVLIDQRQIVGEIVGDSPATPFLWLLETPSRDEVHGRLRVCTAPTSWIVA